MYIYRERERKREREREIEIERENYDDVYIYIYIRIYLTNFFPDMSLGNHLFCLQSVSSDFFIPPEL